MQDSRLTIQKKDNELTEVARLVAILLWALLLSGPFLLRNSLSHNWNWTPLVPEKIN